MIILRKELAIDASTPTMSNSMVEGVKRCVSILRPCREEGIRYCDNLLTQVIEGSHHGTCQGSKNDLLLDICLGTLC